MKKHFSLIFFLVSAHISAKTFCNYSNKFLNIGVDAAALGVSKLVVATSKNHKLFRN